MHHCPSIFACVALASLLAACNHHVQPKQELQKGTYGHDLALLKKNTRVSCELYDSSGLSRVLLCADYEGRVMTSTAAGDSGNSFGWLNETLIASGQKKRSFNPYGGEERFWLGPEGGQFSIYFKKGDSFNIGHWQVPALLDTVAYHLVSADASQAEFSKEARIVNYSGTPFDIAIRRRIRLLQRKDIEERLHISLPTGLRFVGYESVNQVRNQGKDTWGRENGLLSIWLLGMMTPTDATQVIIPFHPGPDSRSYITDNYFGSIPPDRLMVGDSVLFFRCDGRFRSKIGLSPRIAKPMAASFDFKRNILTLVLPQVYPDSLYVNSKWEIQQRPFAGDVINSYNDGPLADGSQLGPFYEVESSSPARELRPGEAEEYSQATCHFQGDYLALKALVFQLLKVDLDTLKKW
ncbi:MAG TPA: DUF6786 family protein [Puia sp.]|nr:DUF6786 family protein [Puia sp.]